MTNEPRLIDAQALEAEVNRCRDVCKSIKSRFTTHDVIACIKIAPTVDAVEVVRCKDCRKCSIYDDAITGQKEYVCRLWHGATREVDADSFCDAGERREGE